MELLQQARMTPTTRDKRAKRTTAKLLEKITTRGLVREPHHA
jgi:hypothetical protein